MILIDSIYINTGGGKVLLELLMNTIAKIGKENVMFLLDKRLETESVKHYLPEQMVVLTSTEAARKSFYLTLPEKITKIFCFANVPPPITIKSIPIIVYYHSPILSKIHSTGLDLLKKKINSLIKRTYIKYRNKANYHWLVQTPSMKKLVQIRLGVSADKIDIVPFFDEDRINFVNMQLPENRHKFLYISDGTPHKNMFGLLKAWQLIQEKNSQLELHLNVAPNFVEINHKINELKASGVAVINHGRCTIEQIIDLYRNCNYLIFPSLSESFGLPMLEAANAGCEVISSDLPYVYDVIKPLSTFNPYKPASIAEAVLAITEQPERRGTVAIIKNELNRLLTDKLEITKIN